MQKLGWFFIFIFNLSVASLSYGNDRLVLKVIESLHSDHGSNLKHLMGNKNQGADFDSVRNVLMDLIHRPGKFQSIFTKWQMSATHLSNLALGQVGSFLRIDENGKWHPADLAWANSMLAQTNPNSIDDRALALYHTLAQTGSVAGFEMLGEVVKLSNVTSLQMSLVSEMSNMLQRHDSLDANQKNPRLDIKYHQPYVPYLQQSFHQRRDWQQHLHLLSEFKTTLEHFERMATDENDKSEWRRLYQVVNQLEENDANSSSLKVVKLKRDNDNGRNQATSQARSADKVKADTKRAPASEEERSQNESENSNMFYSLLVAFVIAAAFILFKRFNWP
jgi:hypothetical protein